MNTHVCLLHTRELLLGPAGSGVRLDFTRIQPNAVGSAVAFFGFDAAQLQQNWFSVTVKRGACPPPTPHTPGSMRSVGQENISSNLSILSLDTSMTSPLALLGSRNAGSTNAESHGQRPVLGSPVLGESQSLQAVRYEAAEKLQVLDALCAHLQEENATMLADRETILADRDAVQAQLLLSLGSHDDRQARQVETMAHDLEASRAELRKLAGEGLELAARLQSSESLLLAERQHREAAVLFSRQQATTHSDDSQALESVRAEARVDKDELEACKNELEAFRSELGVCKMELREQFINSQADLTNLDQVLYF